jgi:hypothetical protein
MSSGQAPLFAATPGAHDGQAARRRGPGTVRVTPSTLAGASLADGSNAPSPGPVGPASRCLRPVALARGLRPRNDVGGVRLVPPPAGHPEPPARTVAAFRWGSPCPARAMGGRRSDTDPVLSAPAAASVRRPSEPSPATGRGAGCGRREVGRGDEDDRGAEAGNRWSCETLM